MGRKRVSIRWRIAASFVLVLLLLGGAPALAASSETLGEETAPETAEEQDEAPVATKKGAAVPMNSNCPEGWGGDDARTLGAGWLYSWGTRPPLVNGVESVPMLWDEFDGCPELGGNSEWVMGFNERDHFGLANLSPEEGAEQWRQVEQCYPDKKLLSPAPAFGTTWLEEMREAYIAASGEAPRFDAVAMHCYGGDGFVPGCQRKARSYATKLEAWDVPGGLWLTEFGCVDPDREVQVENMEQALAWVETDPHITRYSWFATRYKGDEVWAFGTDHTTALAACESGELTALGELYVEAEAYSQIFLPFVMR